MSSGQRPVPAADEMRSNYRYGSSPAAYPPRGERRESARKPGVQGGRGELLNRVASCLSPSLFEVALLSHYPSPEPYQEARQ